MTQPPARTAPGPALTLDEAVALAEKHGLRPLGERPSLGGYLRELWARRSFLWTLSRAQSDATHTANRLGSLWSLLNPMLLVASYFFVFGVLLRQNNSIANYIGFLSIGIVMYQFTSNVVQAGSRSISGGTGLVRALHFPRALLPLSVAVTEVLRLLPALGVLMILMLATQEWPTVEWLLLPATVGLQLLTLIGLALIGARLVNISPDMNNLIPVVLRIMRYVSGVFFVIHDKLQGVLGDVMTYQPLAVTLNITRDCLMQTYDATPAEWATAVAWAVVLPVVGMIFFWVDEAKYGRG